MRKILLSILLVFFTLSAAQGEDFDRFAFIRERALKLFPEAVKIRRYLHENPELGNREEKTTKFITSYLKECGLEVIPGKEGYGVKGVLRGKGEGPVIGLRADMDALPLDEQNDIPFKSRNLGVMHACGHDVHMTNVLIAAKIASSMKDQIDGTLVFIFQPCEEGPPPGEKGGASRLIEEGVLENPHIDSMIGLHVLPDLESGQIGVREGAMMANVDSFYIDILGKNAHGAYPHKGIDAVYVSALAITEFQGIISRMRDPVEPAVLTVGKIEGGERRNVLAQKAHMEGTVRTFSESTRELIKNRMESILRGFRDVYGVSYTFQFINEAPFLYNDPGLFQKVMTILEQIIEKKNIVTLPPQTIAEDFAYYSREIPSFFFFLGVGNSEKGYTGGLHTPTLMVDEEVLKTAPALLLDIALSFYP